MAIELAEHDEQGTASNPRLWLEHAAGYVAQNGVNYILRTGMRVTILQRMADSGLGDYRNKPRQVQDAAISTAIETAHLFMK